MTGAHFLFARPSFVEGAARIFDFSNTLSMYNYSKNDDEADARALYSDWVAVGDDFVTVMNDMAGQITPQVR